MCPLERMDANNAGLTQLALVMRSFTELAAGRLTAGKTPVAGKAPTRGHPASRMLAASFAAAVGNPQSRSARLVKRMLFPDANLRW